VVLGDLSFLIQKSSRSIVARPSLFYDLGRSSYFTPPPSGSTSIVSFSCTHSIFLLELYNTQQSTGVVVDEEVSNTFQDFKLQKGEKLRYYIYEIKDKKTVVISSKGERSKTYDDFVDELPEAKSRYGLIDLEFETKDGRPTSKLVFISWNPDVGSIRDKMLYSGSKEAIKSALNGVGIHINCTDASELDFETSILPTCQNFT